MLLVRYAFVFREFINYSNIFFVNYIGIITSFFCSNSVNLLNILLGSDDKNIVFETPEAETIKPGDLSNFIRVLSQVDLLP